MSWTIQPNAFDGDFHAYGFQVVCANDLVVMSGRTDNDIPVPTIQWSNDHGETWNLASVNPITDGGSVQGGTLCWSEDLGLWLNTGWSGSGWMICTSPDADVWTQRFFDSGSTYAYGASQWLGGSVNLFVVVTWGSSGGSTGRLLTSPNGTAWTAHDTCRSQRSWSIAWSEPLGMAVLGGERGSSGTKGPIATSTDGINWTNRTTAIGTGDSDDGYKVIWSDTWNAFFASGLGKVVKSVDGINWTDINPVGFNAYKIAELRDGTIVLPNDEYGRLSRDGGATWLTQPFFPATDFVEDAASDSVQNYICGNMTGDGDTLMLGDPIRVIPAPGPGGVGGVGGSPLWKFFIASLDGTGISDYSKLARDRVVEVILNGPLSMRGGVPSDNPQVNLPYTDDGYDDSYLNEGTRLLWGFRRESYESPYYVVRAATIIQLLNDSAAQDNAVSSFQGWDPWHYMMSRPVCNVDGSLPGQGGLSYSNTQASVIVATLLQNTIDNHGFAFIDAGTTYSGSYSYGGTMETGPGMEIDINFPQGTTVGQAWQMIADMGVCDIVLTPIYAPGGRTLTDFSQVYNFLVELSVYAQAGSTHDELIFAWDLPGRSLVGLDRQLDGSVRANNVKLWAGPGGNTTGGTSIPVADDPDSVAKFGEYWAMQAFPGAQAFQVTDLASQIVSLRGNGRQTVTFKPAPERSPRPWQDYNLGDRVPVWASRNFRAVIGEALVGTTAETQYQRIYGWTANLSDDALETIDPVLTSPEEAV